MASEALPSQFRLQTPVDPKRDHMRGDFHEDAAIFVVTYQDFLCPYCRRLRPVLRRARETLGDRLVFVYRHLPNERAHPGAELAARASEAAARQGRFFEMHDQIFDRALPIEKDDLFDIARSISLDKDRFEQDLASDEVRARVEQDAHDARKNGVTGTPTLFVDGLLYDGAWDFFSFLEALERPIAARVQRSARVFASIPASAGIVLVASALLAIVCANTPIAGSYERIMSTPIGIGPPGRMLLLSVRDWIGEGFLSVFFLLVGLEIRREATAGALASWRAALLPVLAAMGGVAMPALIYLLCNRGPSARGWPIPTATDVALTLGLLAVLGSRIPVSLRVFVATLAVADDVLSVVTLAMLSPRSFRLSYAPGVLASFCLLVGLNRARVYARWPYVVVSALLWVNLHELGIHAALSGVLVAACLPTRPAPRAAPLVAQAANALAALEQAEIEARREGRDESEMERGPLWEWAARNLAAASARFLSPAELIERATAPWSAYVILPAFAFSASAVRLAIDFGSSESVRIFIGVVLGLVVGKPLGILLATRAALATRLAAAPEGMRRRHFLGAALLGGVGDFLALLMADRAFSPAQASAAKLGVFTGSVIAAALGMLVLSARPRSETRV